MTHYPLIRVEVGQPDSTGNCHVEVQLLREVGEEDEDISSARYEHVSAGFVNIIPNVRVTEVVV